MVGHDARRTGILVGALVGTAVIAVGPLFPSLSPAGRYALATMFFAAVLWVTEALPLPVTALCIPILLSVFGVHPTFAAGVVGFADPVIFLLLAGFMLARTLQKYGIDRRVAFHLVHRLGTSPRRLVLALMVATALLSMVISNSATTAMMVPVALGVARQVSGTPTPVERAPAPVTSNMEIAALLGTAYAASIGGVGTLIGTPPNAIVVSQLFARLGYRITFVDWLLVGLPLVAVSLPLAWYLLTFRIYPPDVDDVSEMREHARETLETMGSLDAKGRRVVYITAATAGLWILGGLGSVFAPYLPATWHTTLFGGSGESIFGTGHQGLLYFVVVGLLAVPALVVAGTVEWDDLADIDWGTLLLLGGGISLANALSETDAVGWLADVTFGSLVGVPLAVLVLTIVVVTILFGELASNTAIAAIFAPLLISLGPRYASSLGTSAETASVFLAITGAVAASFGFALPVATPPNAIVFGTGRMDKDHMLRAGVVLDVVLALVVTAVLLALFALVWPTIR